MGGRWVWSPTFACSRVRALSLVRFWIHKAAELSDVPHGAAGFCIDSLKRAELCLGSGVLGHPPDLIGIDTSWGDAARNPTPTGWPESSLTRGVPHASLVAILHAPKTVHTTSQAAITATAMAVDSCGKYDESRSPAGPFTIP